MDYKRFYIRVKKTYPFVARELNPEPCLKDWQKIPEVLDQYCSVTGSMPDWVSTNTKEHRTKFVAVVCKMADPIFFNYSYRMNYKLRKNLSSATNCTNKQISDTLNKVRGFLKVYPDFRAEIDEIWMKLCKCEK
jgi:hypothetical protein